MTGARPFPPSSGGIREWGDTFNHARAIGLYINQVRMAAILLNFQNEWVAAEIRILANGARGERERGFASPNFSRPSDLFGIIESEGWKSNIGMIAFLSYLFSLRVPSESIHLRVCARVSETYEAPHQNDKALIGPIRL